MKWSDKIGNRFKLTYRPWSVKVMHFNGEHWASDGKARGPVVEMKTWLGETWFVRPENALFTKSFVAAMQEAMSVAMLTRVKYEDCDCGCERQTPVDGYSAAWRQAASMVRCWDVETKEGQP